MLISHFQRRRFIGLLTFLLFSSTAYTCFARPISVVLVSPSPRVEGFWQLYEDVMVAAAKDLHIELSIIHAESTDRFEHLHAVEQAVKGEVKPDYLVTLFRENTGDRMLRLLQQKNVKFFSTNADIPENQRVQIGDPRSKYANWIAHMYPDDNHAGQLLAELLNNRWKDYSSNAKLTKLLAISGSRDSPAVYHRNAGLNQVITATQSLYLQQLIFTDWQYETVYQLTPQLLRRYPDANAIWCGNDEIAKAFLDAIAAHKIQKQFVIGSIDWSYRGISGFKEGELVTSIGGHFLEGGIILALLKNYHNGHDFSERLGTVIKMQMSALDEANINTISRLVMKNDWGTINFSLLPKLLNQNAGEWQNNYWQLTSKLIKPASVKVGEITP